MAQSQYQPLHSDRNKSPFNFLLIAGLVAIGLGLFFGAVNPSMVVIGLGVVAYAWFTTPTKYELFNDRLIIKYGQPRIKHVMFQNIEGVDNLMVPLSGPRLRVREARGRGVWLTPRDPETFMDQFRQAMEAFRGETSSEEESGIEWPSLGEGGQPEVAETEGANPTEQQDSPAHDSAPSDSGQSEAEQQGRDAPAADADPMQQQDPWDQSSRPRDGG